VIVNGSVDVTVTVMMRMTVTMTVTVLATLTPEPECVIAHRSLFPPLPHPGWRVRARVRF
jgi:hypothetical protein